MKKEKPKEMKKTKEKDLKRKILEKKIFEEYYTIIYFSFGFAHLSELLCKNKLLL
jgi:hypothetical protein